MMTSYPDNPHEINRKFKSSKSQRKLASDANPSTGRCNKCENIREMFALGEKYYGDSTNRANNSQNQESKS